MENGHLRNAQVAWAQNVGVQRGLDLRDVLTAHFDLAQLSIAQAQAHDLKCEVINPLEHPPDPQLPAQMGAATCLRQSLLPWRRIGDTTIVLTARPERFARYMDDLSVTYGNVRMALATDHQITQSLCNIFAKTLSARAESRVATSESCRNWNSDRTACVGLACGLVMLCCIIVMPYALFTILALLSITVLGLTTLLKAGATLYGLRRDKPAINTSAVVPARLPVITLLIPLYREKAVADHLLARLNALDYPRELLDVCLVMEHDDVTTRDTLGHTTLPTWMRAIIVPMGTLRTKPRALNFALDFARGSIIGVYDAEDAPAVDQLQIVARHFANRDGTVACLQGVLDYYNTSANWLTRCFTLEYASWFRVILPGLARMGLVIPLGGTTLFFRRHILEELGGWDAHNVTEDADLGVRLARHGYRTELIATTTEEEANGRFWPWIKQRSRWLKGYAVTYVVHMRDPVRLWRDLGAWRFAGVQLLFLGTLLQFVLAPVLWSLWLVPFGFVHPLGHWLSGPLYYALIALFILSELVNLTASIGGVIKAGKRRLAGWALTLHFYFPMAAVAAYKGLFELAWKPFYWEKTTHGVLLPKGVIPPPQPPAHPISNA